LRQLGLDFDAEATVFSEDEITISKIAIRLQTQASRDEKPFAKLRRLPRRTWAWLLG
jgi:hypothetical protein